MRLKEIKPGMVIHCKTQEEANILCDTIGGGFKWKRYWVNHREATCYKISNDGFYSFGRIASYKDSNITEFSSLILPELTAEEVLQAMGEICNSQQFCNDCPISKAIKDNGKGTSYCFNKLHTHTDKVINVCAQWKSDHEKKEPEIETEWFWQGRILKINEDDCYCQINDGTGFYDTGCEYRESAEEYMEGELKEYCKTHEGKFIAVVDHVCRIKR